MRPLKVSFRRRDRSARWSLNVPPVQKATSFPVQAPPSFPVEAPPSQVVAGPPRCCPVNVSSTIRRHFAGRRKVHATLGVCAPATKSAARIPTVAWTIQRTVGGPRVRIRLNLASGSTTSRPSVADAPALSLITATPDRTAVGRIRQSTGVSSPITLDRTAVGRIRQSTGVSARSQRSWTWTAVGTIRHSMDASSLITATPDRTAVGTIRHSTGVSSPITLDRTAGGPVRQSANTSAPKVGHGCPDLCPGLSKQDSACGGWSG